MHKYQFRSGRFHGALGPIALTVEEGSWPLVPQSARVSSSPPLSVSPPLGHARRWQLSSSPHRQHFVSASCLQCFFTLRLLHLLSPAARSVICHCHFTIALSDDHPPHSRLRPAPPATFLPSFPLLLLSSLSCCNSDTMPPQRRARSGVPSLRPTLPRRADACSCRKRTGLKGCRWFKRGQPGPQEHAYKVSASDVASTVRLRHQRQFSIGTR